MTTQDAKADDRSIAGEIARTLGARIVEGELAPGAPLRQDHVAAEFGASHIPVREAFRRLEAQGLVVAAPRRGVRVAPLDAAAITEVTEMRAALEALALRHAVPRLTAADFEIAARALAEGEASGDVAVWEAANSRFHLAITRPAAMPRLTAALDDLQRASARFLIAGWRELGWRPRSDGEHRAILSALRAGDAERAIDLLTCHILAAGHTLAEALAAPAGGGNSKRSPRQRARPRRIGPQSR